MYRVTVACSGIAPNAWPDAVLDVHNEFEARPHHKIVSATWLGEDLVVVAENDYDSDGEALADEFSDTVAAYAPCTLEFHVRIVSAVPVDNYAA